MDFIAVPCARRRAAKGRSLMARLPPGSMAPFMLSASEEHRRLYEARCRKARLEWLRRLPPESALALYEGLNALANAAARDASAFDERRRQEKLAVRKRIHGALVDLDRRRG